MKVVSGARERTREETVWERFDRLQRSLRPLRRSRQPEPGIYYGRQQTVKEKDEIDRLFLKRLLNGE